MDVVPATILMYEQNKYPIPYDVAKEWIWWEMDYAYLY